MAAREQRVTIRERALRIGLRLGHDDHGRGEGQAGEDVEEDGVSINATRAHDRWRSRGR